MKKIIFIVAFVLISVGAEMQTYASSVLDTNIISLIGEHILGIVNSNSPKLINNDFNVGDYIDQKDSQLNNDLQQYQNDQAEKAQQDLNQYIDQVKSEIDALYQNKEDESKQVIKNNIDQQVSQIKQKIHDDLEKKLNKR